MILNKLLRCSSSLVQLNKRTYFSSRINTMFINNFEKYFERLKTDEKSNSHTKVHIENLLKEFAQLTASINDVERELNDKLNLDDWDNELKEEKVELTKNKNELVAEILNEIYSYELRKDNERIADSSSVLFEISPGVGGKEAMLFGNKLFEMYDNYFRYKDWVLYDVEIDEQNGGLRHYHAKIEGNDVWGHMKFEAGVHRVQRIPETEARGRIHTSTVSLACIPITVDAGVQINGQFSKKGLKL